MRSAIAVCVAVVVAAVVGCKKDSAPSDNTKVVAQPNTGSGSAVQRPTQQQIPPPYDLKTPPSDAIKTASGLVYKKMTVATPNVGSGSGAGSGSNAGSGSAGSGSSARN